MSVRENRCAGKWDRESLVGAKGNMPTRCVLLCGVRAHISERRPLRIAPRIALVSEAAILRALVPLVVVGVVALFPMRCLL